MGHAVFVRNGSLFVLLYSISAATGGWAQHHVAPAAVLGLCWVMLGRGSRLLGGLECSVYSTSGSALLAGAFRFLCVLSVSSRHPASHFAKSRARAARRQHRLVSRGLVAQKTSHTRSLLHTSHPNLWRRAPAPNQSRMVAPHAARHSHLAGRNPALRLLGHSRTSTTARVGGQGARNAQTALLNQVRCRRHHRFTTDLAHPERG